ncbi:hypothetical protein [Xenorhabdus doucetiae]|uniref:hypothetical protein n=1 Tax=Xenorhabdus doucetiae TaxID=351671 RepID=UPI0012EDFCBC|nr:hypothetical protein [Xenorhabdus doucetiae]
MTVFLCGRVNRRFRHDGMMGCIKEAGTVIFAFLQLAGRKPLQARALWLILLPQLGTNLRPTWWQLATCQAQLANIIGLWR